MMPWLAVTLDLEAGTAEAFGDALLGYLHHRGIGSGPGDVSRFFDAHFGQEIEEHSGRMRELIAGRDVSVDSGVSWGSDAEDDRRDTEEPADRGSRPSGDLAARHSAGALSLDDLGDGSRDVDDEMPAERTRIEANPLERINELERLSGRAAAVQGDGPTQLAPSDAVPMPPPPPGQVGPQSPPVAMAAPSAATSASGPRPASPPGMPPSGRFPDLANLPTVIAGADPPVPVPPSPTAPAALPAHARTQIAAMPAAASGTSAPGAPAGPPGYPVLGGSAGLGPGDGGGPLPGMPPLRPQSASVPPPLAQGYPVLNAQLSEQIATGATVFPSEPPRGGAPHPGPPMPASPPARGSEPGRPPDGYLPPLPSDGGMPGGMSDAQRAAGVMSPVGQQYPEHIDWASVAASRARVVPPWLLAALFIGAIGIALALTVVVARLIR